MSANGAAGLTLGGWLFLLFAWGLIFGVTLFCFRRILQTRDRKRP